MKTYQLALASSMSVLLLFGCSKTEREPETAPRTQTTVEKPTQQPSEITIKTREFSRSVLDSTVAKTIEVAGQTTNRAEKTKEAVIEIADQAATNTKELAKKTEATTKKVSQQIIEKTAAAEKSAVNNTAATTDKAEILVKEPTESINTEVNTTKASVPLKVPEIIILKNKKGEITLPHKRHATTFACTHCHGDSTPGHIKLGQEKGHTICKGCHQEKGGPTACIGCHAKKAIKPAEGC